MSDWDCLIAICNGKGRGRTLCLMAKYQQGCGLLGKGGMVTLRNLVGSEVAKALRRSWESREQPIQRMMHQGEGMRANAVMGLQDGYLDSDVGSC